MAILRNVSKQDTLESQRQVINLIASDLYGYTSGGQSISLLAGEFGNGSAANPSIRFASDLSLGLFREGSSKLGISSNGKQIVSFAPNGSYFTRNFYGEKRSLLTSGIAISDGGDDYVQGTYTSVGILGGSGVGAEANITVNATGNVSDVSITNGGYGYAIGDSLYVNDKDISNSDGTSGEVKTLTVTNAGFNYTDGDTYPTFYDSGTGTGTGLTVVVDTEPVGKVLALGTINGGSGYTTTSNAPFTTSGSGTDLQLDIVAGVNGLVEELTAVGYGSGYPATGSNVATTSDGSGTGLTVNYTASIGGILSTVTIVDNGSGYLESESNVTFTGSTSGINATASITATSINSVTTFSIVEDGTGYTNGTYNLEPVNTLNPPPGVGCTVSVTTAGGLVTNVTVVAGGSAYVIGDQYFIDAGNVDAIIQVSAVNPGGDILSVDITQGGEGYVVGETLTVVSSTSSTATVSVATVTGGSISSINIVDKGTNYEIGDTVSISGGSTAATYTVNAISGGDITAVSIVTPNNSSGFAVNDVITFTAGNGAGNILVSEVTSGQVTGVTVASSGQDYNIGDVLVIQGGGQTALITVSETFDGSGFSLSVNDLLITTPISSNLLDGSIDALIGNINTVISNVGTIAAVSSSTVYASISVTTPEIISDSSLNFDVSGDVNVTAANINLGSTLTLESSTGNIFADGKVEATELIVDNTIGINNNNISTLTNNPLLLTPNSNNLTKISSNSALVIPVGSTSQRPLSAAETGAIRFNTDIQQYEGYNSSNNLWSSLGGVRDSDGNTYIIPEASSGANDNILYFYNNGSNTLRLSPTELQFYDVDTISSLSGELHLSSTDIIIDNNLSISSNIISTSTSSLTLQPASGTNVVISGTASVAIPVGTNAQRGTAVAGGIRYNTSISQFEGYSGTNWTSLGGVRDVDGNTYIVPESFPGANDNVLYFVSDGVNAVKITSTELRLEGANNIKSVNLTGVSEWQPATAYSAGQNVYYGINVYQVTANFTSGGTAPTHTSGTTSNLLWIRTIYGSVTFDSTITKLFVNTTLNINNQLEIANSTITSSLEDIIIQPEASKKVKIDSTTSIVVPSGTSLERGTPESGSIRYNTTVSQFEGYSGTAWTSLGGVRDVDGNTYIIPESVPGANENILYFYNDAVNTLRLSSTELIFQGIDTITSTSQTLDINSNLVEFNSGLLNIDTSSASTSKIYSIQNNLDIGLTTGLVNDTLLRFTGSGQLSINTAFGSGAEDYEVVLDKSLTNFNLQHVSTKTEKYTLIKGTNNFGSYILFDPSVAESCKVTIVAVDSSNGNKHMVDYNVITKGSDIYNIEYESLLSGSLLYDATFDFTASGEARITTTLSDDVSSGSNILFTVINTIIKK